MNLLYPSRKGGKPLNIGMKRAKRIARSADKRDQVAVLRELGPNLPRQHSHSQELIKRRHQYYADIGAEAEAREQHRLEAQKSGSESANATNADDADRALPEPAPGTTDQ
jgi:hypothetical protein